MMGWQDRDQRQLFYEFSLDEIGRPSIDPELMIRMLLVGYCYGIRYERRLCQEVALHLAYRWFCKLDLDDKVPHHSTFSVNRLGRFRESDILRHIFERVVAGCMAAGLVKGEGFAVDASVIEANASRYHGKAPDELDWTDAQRQKRAVAEYLAALDAESEAEEGGDNSAGGSDGTPTPKPDRKPPKVISPSDPSSAWTAKANKRVQFGYGLNYLIDIENAVIVDVEPTPARTYDEVESTKTASERHDGTFSRSDFRWDKRRGVYICPNNKVLHTTGTVHDGNMLRYRASKADCDVCMLKMKCCPNMSTRQVPRDVHEEARDAARRLMGTKGFLRSRDERKRVEMRFAHLKSHHGFERMRLRGLSGARDEFHLAAIVQNLKTLALRALGPPTAPSPASLA